MKLVSSHFRRFQFLLKLIVNQFYLMPIFLSEGKFILNWKKISIVKATVKGWAYRTVPKCIAFLMNLMMKFFNTVAFTVDKIWKFSLRKVSVKSIKKFFAKCILVENIFARIIKMTAIAWFQWEIQWNNTINKTEDLKIIKNSFLIIF